MAFSLLLCKTMERLHNLKEAICSFENLYAAYQEAAKDKRYREEVIIFRQNLEENLIQLQKELDGMYYKVGPYREFYVRYPKPRLVMALQFRDRIVQWAIYRQIDPFVDKRFITHSYGCRKGKGTLAAAEYLLDCLRIIDRKPDADDYVIVKGDISKYFYRVDHNKSMEMYADISDDIWFLWIMDVIINNPDVPFGVPLGMSIDECPRDERLYDVGMPIGNLSSQETANIYLDKLDQYCKHVLKLHFYVRYMDDFIFICKREDAERLFGLVTEFITKELMLTVSPKSRILPARNGCEFVGYRVTPHGLRLRKKTTKHMKKSLMHVAEMYALGAIDLESALATKQCYFGMTEHCNGQYMRQWIADHFVLCRNSGEDYIPQESLWFSDDPYDEGRLIA